MLRLWFGPCQSTPLVSLRGGLDSERDVFVTCSREKVLPGRETCGDRLFAPRSRDRPICDGGVVVIFGPPSQILPGS